METSMRMVACGVLQCLFLAIAPIWAGAESTAVRVAYTEWFPYTFTQDEAPAGFEIEILQTVFAAMNVAPTFNSYPWKRCLGYLESGQADALVSMLKTPDREAYAHYPEEHISVSRTSFFTVAAKRIYYTGDYRQLKQYKIGVILGFSYGDAFDQASFLDKDASIDAKTLLSKLIMQRIDVGAENEAVLSAEAARMQVEDKIMFLSPPIHTQHLYVGFSKAKNLASLCQRFSSELAAFKKTERYVAILKKYRVRASGQ